MEATQTTRQQQINLADQARKIFAARHDTTTFEEYCNALEVGYELDEWQLAQMKIALDPSHPEVLIIRSRSGSKTFDMMEALLYMAWIGLTAIFFVSKGKQTKQPKKYLQDFKTKTFLKYAFDRRYALDLSVRFHSGGEFSIVHLTEGNCRSLRADILYFDEESQADLVAFNASTPILAHSFLAKTIHGSTPQKGTVFEKNYQRLRQKGAPILSRKWHEISFINKDLVAREKETKPGWFFRQEYECSFEAPMGKVFENVLEGDFDSILALQRTDKHRRHTHYGVDWNPSAGHWIAGTRYSDDGHKLFILMEKNLGTDLKTVLNFLFQLHEKDPDSIIEVEDGGTNTGFCEALELIAREMGLDFSWMVRREWDSQGKNKMLSITCTYDSTIYVNPLITPELAYWLDVAHWDAESDTPKLEKDPDQHPLDCGLHSFYRAWAQLKTLRMEWI